MQMATGITEPDYGIIFDDMVLDSGCTVKWDQYTHPRIEMELAFKLKKDISGSGTRPEDERLPAGRTIAYGFQHVLTMYGGIIAPPLVMGGAAGMNTAEMGVLVASCLFIGGLATILQTLGVPFFGAQLPLVQGTRTATWWMSSPPSAAPNAGPTASGWCPTRPPRAASRPTSRRPTRWCTASWWPASPTPRDSRP